MTTWPLVDGVILTSPFTLETCTSLPAARVLSQWKSDRCCAATVMATTARMTSEWRSMDGGRVEGWTGGRRWTVSAADGGAVAVRGERDVAAEGLGRDA